MSASCHVLNVWGLECMRVEDSDAATLSQHVFSSGMFCQPQCAFLPDNLDQARCAFSSWSQRLIDDRRLQFWETGGTPSPSTNFMTG
jgi:hypothetical protein